MGFVSFREKGKEEGGKGWWCLWGFREVFCVKVDLSGRLALDG